MAGEAGRSGLSSRTGMVRFESTAWSVIAEAQGDSRGTSDRGLALLIERYWRPVFAFIRQFGNTHEDAKDLAQGFFTEFIERDAVSYADRTRGRFRTFLLASVKRYLALQHRRGMRRPVLVGLPDFDRGAVEPSFATKADEGPERAFMKNWAKCLLENSIALFRAECEAVGKDELYKVFEARYLSDADRFPSCSDIGRALGKSEVKVAKLLQRARARVARYIRQEAGNTARMAHDADAEIDELISCLA